MSIHIAWLYLTHFGFVRFLKLCFLIIIRTNCYYYAASRFRLLLVTRISSRV